MQVEQQKTVFITGCSSGIGHASAHLLHQLNFKVVASVRNPNHITRLTDLGIECIHLDLSDEHSVQSAVDYLHGKHPNLYALVNNGAYGQPGAVEDLSRTALKAQFETNLFGTHDLTQKLLPLLRKQTTARIIQVSSVLGFVALPLRGAYNASKFALEGLSDTLRLELKNTNIEVILIEPGAIDTQFRSNALLQFEQHINPEGSHYMAQYEAARVRLERTEPGRFALPAASVAKDIHHALTAKRPKLRYRQTLPTIVIAKLKRILSTRMMDKILSNDR
ncbi:short-chain dehydrogenase/reductase [Arenicella chitinivorans]|uniref:Short-chain dehydrogenase/reductase n=1 Tax=Arenicella chitinivorans TaxID=1329800 RepID=A0A918RJY3_9GAMM|nr:SDR family NAD(P)-dependent oxidoreductase [Arenicella chitinivorans]GHA01743.1 short-chain dehydrogenase/reductase [Arenicella chitinivorans]